MLYFTALKINVFMSQVAEMWLNFISLQHFKCLKSPTVEAFFRDKNILCHVEAIS